MNSAAQAPLRTVKGRDKAGVHSVHSLDRIVYTVPDLAEGEKFFDTFGLDVRRHGNQLDLYTHGHPHLWVSVHAAPGPKKLQYLRFGWFAEDLEAIGARLDKMGIARCAPHPLGDASGIWIKHPDGFALQITGRAGRERHLAQLARNAARVEVIEQARELHRDRRPPLSRAAAAGTEGRPHQRRGIDAGMPVEVAILVQQQGLQVIRAHLRERGPEAILLIGCQGEAQQFALSAVDGRGCRDTARQRAMREQAHEERARHHEQNYQNEAASASPDHGRMTLMWSAAERARTLESYIDSP